MSDAKIARLGNFILLQDTHDDGSVEYRVDPHDVTPEAVYLQDAAGRHREFQAHASTVLVVAVIGDFGALMFDPEIDMTGAHPVPIRHDGKRVYKQRNILSRLDVLNMVEDAFKRQALEQRVQLAQSFPGNGKVLG